MLEGVLEYVREAAENSGKLDIKGEPKERTCDGDDETETLTRQLKHMFVHPTIPRGVFAGAFDTAPMGMCMASVTGELVWYNQNFNSIFGVGQAHMSQPPTLFSLTAPESLQSTMMVKTDPFSPCGAVPQP